MKLGEFKWIDWFRFHVKKSDKLRLSKDFREDVD